MDRSASGLAWGPTIALALLPKCPLCAAAWMGLVGASWAGAALGPLTLLFSTAAVTWLAVCARRSGRRAPVAVGAVAAAALVAARCGVPIPAMPWTGAALLALAVVWSSRSRPAARARCARCGPVDPFGSYGAKQRT